MAEIAKYMNVGINNIAKIFGISKSSIAAVGGGSIPAAGGDRGVFGGGVTVNTIEYITISTPGNSTDFGDLTAVRGYLSATSNGATDRGIFAGGYSDFNIIEYITILTTGDATDFGDLIDVGEYSAATSNGTNDRGIVVFNNTPMINNIEYITISSPSNGTDFGDLTQSGWAGAATSNGTNDRGVVGGRMTAGGGAATSNVIDYITISSTGNASDFGDLTRIRYSLASTSNTTNERGVFAGGYDNTAAGVNIIDYITINSIGNAIDFGDLTQITYAVSSTSNGTSGRGVFAGGVPVTNVISYISISSLGNANDFGDLSATRYYMAPTSNA